MNVTLKKIPDGNNEVYQVRYWQNGKYVRKQFLTRDLAVAHRDGLKRDSEWSSDQLVPAQDRQSVFKCYERSLKGGYTLAQACDLFEANLLMKIEPINLGDAIVMFIASKSTKGLRERSIQNITSRMETLKEKIGASTMVHNITANHIESCMDRSWKPRTVITIHVIAHGFFEWCIKKKFCKTNPVRDLDRPMVEKASPIILTPTEVSDLLNNTRKKAPQLIPYVAISVFAGVRNHELRRLSWSDVDLDTGLITIGSHKAKTRQRRIVTIQPNLMAWLKLGGALPPVVLKSKWSKVRPARFEIDCMRRTFCSYHLAEFESAAKTSLEAGHTESVLFSHYRGIVTKQSSALFWKIVP